MISSKALSAILRSFSSRDILNDVSRSISLDTYKPLLDKIKKDEIKLSKTYRLKTSSAQEATTALLALEEVGISEFNIAQIKCTKIEEYKDEARVIAMKDAHRKAKLLTEAINQPLGKAIYITENDFTNVRTYPRLMMSKSNGAMEDAVAESEIADISFEKIKIESRVQIKFALE